MMLSGLYPALAEPGAGQGQNVDAKIKEIDAKMKDLERLKAELEQLRGQIQQAAPAAPAKENWTDKYTLVGYVHNRYEARKNANTRDDFFLRRMYLGLAGKFSDRASGMIMLDRAGGIGPVAAFPGFNPPGTPDPGIMISMLYGEYKLTSDWSVRFGQVPTNWGWDVGLSASTMLPFERCAMGEGFATRPGRAGVPGLFYLGYEDRGVYFIRNPRKPEEPKVFLGVVNGNFRYSDNNDNKAVSLDLRWTQPKVSYGINWLDGKFVNPGTGVNQDRGGFGLYVHSDPKPWGFQAEYSDFDLLGTEREGWYGQVAYNQGSYTPFFRLESYDTDKNVVGDTLDGWHLGCAYQVDKRNRVTLEYVGMDRLGVDYGQTGLQWQLGF
jgi:hypothetical protein